MNQAVENLLTRRSIRRYQKTQITDEELHLVLEAGTYAPTAMGSQSPVMAVVQNPQTISLLSRLNAAIMGTDSDPFYGAPTVIVVFGDSTQKNYIQDASLVMGNLMNAAHGIGLGSCWINRAREVFETTEGKELMKTWGIPGHYAGIGNCILGYPDQDIPEPKSRKRDYIIMT